MKKILFFVIFATANLYFFGQIPKQWKEIELSDFKYETNEATSIHAVILQESISYNFDIWHDELRLVREISKRVLIIDTIGLKYKDLKINYIGLNDFEIFTAFQAFTYNYSKNIIKKTKFKPRKIEYSNENNYNSTATVSFPDVQVGSIIEYRYKIYSLEIVKPSKWQFQHEIPTVYSSFDINLPDFINYIFNFIDVFGDIKQKKEANSLTLNYIYNHRDMIPSGTSYQNQSFSANVNLFFQTVKYTFEVHNLGAFPNEKCIDSRNNYLTAINLDLYRINDKTNLVNPIEKLSWISLSQRIYETAQENYQIEQYNINNFNTDNFGFIVFDTNNWNTLDKKLSRNANFGIQLMRALPYKTILSEIINENDDNFTKMVKVFNFIHKNYKWNKVYSVYTSANLTDIMKAKTGNSADINLLLIYFLRKAGINTKPLIIKTISQGHLNEELSNIGQFNHVAAYVTLGNQTYYLDATPNNARWYAVNKEIINSKGRIIDGDNSKFVDISNNMKSEKKYVVNAEIKNNSVKYDIDVFATGYFAKDALTNVDNLKKFFFVDKEFQNFEYNMSSTAEYNGKINFNCKIEKSGSSLSPHDIFNFETPFLNPLRFFPVYMQFPRKISIKYLIKTEDGKAPIQYPKSFEKNINGINFSSKTKIENNTLIWDIKISIYKIYFTTDEYKELRNLFFDIDNQMSTSIL